MGSFADSSCPTSKFTMVKVIATKAEFDALLAGSDKLIVVDFFATWCGPCKMIAPKIEEMEKEYPDVVFCKVDVDENEDTAAACEISAMPTLKFYKGNNKVGEVVGANIASIEKMVKDHM